LAQARQDTAAHQADEAAAVAKLSVADQAKYQALVHITEGTDANGDDLSLARQSLQGLLLDGALTGQLDLASGRTLLDNLSGMATEPLASGIDRAELVSQALSEIADPTAINQQFKGTCVATTAAIVLANMHPAEYVRLIAGLATPAGQVKMAGGDTLTRVSDWAIRNDGDRTVTQRLFVPALMNDGQLPLFHYNNTTDHSMLGPIPAGGGLTPSGSAHIESQLEGTSYQAHTFYAVDRDAQWQQVAAALAQGKGPIPIGVIWSDGMEVGGHELALQSIANGTATYLNPWGDQETMSAKELEAHITSAEMPG
ncbi:MAG: hypothetical protein KGR26_13585, partial [Cyanobacteria bacterium REEB65]|nr:hypothetical protein [Cyanobacteria bacterium REEB65]